MSSRTEGSFSKPGRMGMKVFFALLIASLVALAPAVAEVFRIEFRDTIISGFLPEECAEGEEVAFEVIEEYSDSDSDSGEFDVYIVAQIQPENKDSQNAGQAPPKGPKKMDSQVRCSASGAMVASFTKRAKRVKNDTTQGIFWAYSFAPITIPGNLPPGTMCSYSISGPKGLPRGQYFVGRALRRKGP